MPPLRGTFLLLGALGIVSAISPALAGEPIEVKPSLPARIFQEILPVAWQKRPELRFNVITEMTAEGRKRKPPTPEKPLFYISNPAKFNQAGWLVSAGEKPPPAAELESAMKSALAACAYLPVPRPEDRPDVLLILSYGSSGTDPASILNDDDGAPPISALDLAQIVLRDVALFRDVIERATLVGGEKFARGLKAALDEEVRNANINRAAMGAHLPVSPDFNSPLQLFMSGKNGANVAHLVEVAFHTCYFVIATAYDFDAFEKRQKLVLWRTKMTVEAQGVSMNEALRPLIIATGSHLGREMSEAAVIKKRIDREGRVEIGAPVLVEEAASAHGPVATDKPAAVPTPKSP